MASNYSHFDPLEYIEEYYSSIDAENIFLLDFYDRAYTCQRSNDKTVVEVGGGPTLYQLISASRFAKSIIFTDYLEVNRNEIAKWMSGRGCFHNWEKHFQYVAKLEAPPLLAANDIEQRLRRKIIAIKHVDMWDDHPLSRIGAEQTIDIVSTAFCIEAISPHSKDFEQFVGKLTAPLRPGGTLMMTAILNCSQYRIGGINLPCTPVNADELLRLLKSHKLSIDIHEAMPAIPPRGYDGMIAVCATKQ